MDFHNTVMGRRFFDHQLPELIKGVNRFAAALEAANNKPAAVVPDAQHSVTNRPAFGLNVITQFVGENTLSDNCGDSRWEQLRAMWTAHCAYNSLEVDTAKYDSELAMLWGVIYATQRTGAEVADCAVDIFQNYDAFSSWICKNLV